MLINGVIEICFKWNSIVNNNLHSVLENTLCLLFSTCRANLINQHILFYYRLYITCYICILISCLTFYTHYLNLYYMYYLVTLSRQIHNHTKHTYTRIALLFVGLHNTFWCSRYICLLLNHYISISENAIHV